MGGSVCAFAGTNGIPEAARLVTGVARRGDSLYPTDHRLAHPSEKAVHGVNQHSAWETIQRGHAVANGCYVAVANRIGYEAPDGGRPGIEFWGQSFVSAPSGEILAKASVNKEEILLAEVVDLQQVDVTRTHWPFLRDRRIDAYGDLTKRLHRLNLWNHRLDQCGRNGLIGSNLLRFAPQHCPW